MAISKIMMKERIALVDILGPVAIITLSLAWLRQKRKTRDELYAASKNTISARGIAAQKKGSSYWESFLRVLEVSSFA